MKLDDIFIIIIGILSLIILYKIMNGCLVEGEVKGYECSLALHKCDKYKTNTKCQRCVETVLLNSSNQCKDSGGVVKSYMKTQCDALPSPTPTPTPTPVSCSEALNDCQLPPSGTDLTAAGIGSRMKCEKCTNKISVKNACSTPEDNYNREEYCNTPLPPVGDETIMCPKKVAVDTSGVWYCSRDMATCFAKGKTCDELDVHGSECHNYFQWDDQNTALGEKHICRGAKDYNDEDSGCKAGPSCNLENPTEFIWPLAKREAWPSRQR